MLRKKMSMVNTSKPLKLKKLSYQSYNLFGFLCNIRNYAEISGISCKTRGFPKDASEELIIATEHEYSYSCSWATVEELNNFNYNILYVNKRNDNIVETIEESLGEAYFSVSVLY